MENEQIMTPDSGSETPTRDAVDVFTEILEAEESNDKPEVTNEKQEDIE